MVFLAMYAILVLFYYHFLFIFDRSLLNYYVERIEVRVVSLANKWCLLRNLQPRSRASVTHIVPCIVDCTSICAR